MLKVAINGFGRIGRNVLRAFIEYADDYDGIELVAINDIADNAVLVHLFSYDSTHGRLDARLRGAKAQLIDETAPKLAIFQGERLITAPLMLSESDPAKLPWGTLDIDVVLECTGSFRSYELASLHRKAKARQVIIGAAPTDHVDASIVMGVNDDLLSRDLPIISGVSCTTQALVPLLWLIDQHFDLDSVILTEIHAVTADQSVLDSPHRDLRRARASAYNIIPTTSSSIAATERVLPHLQGRINGHSIRVPTQDVAAIDLSLSFTGTAPSLQALRTVLCDASADSLRGIMDCTQAALVSSDFVHDRHSLICDLPLLMTAGSLIKVFAWYDNEWGYANRLLDMCQRLSQYPQ